jgi:hypothetical protein
MSRSGGPCPPSTPPGRVVAAGLDGTPPGSPPGGVPAAPWPGRYGRAREAGPAQPSVEGLINDVDQGSQTPMDTPLFFAWWVFVQKSE